MNPGPRRLRLLHLHSSFSSGGKELRAAKLMNAFGRGIDHTIVSAVPGELGAASAIEKAISVNFPDDFPSLSGKPLPGRMQKLARAMLGFDLVLTYNWGAMDAVMAHTLFGEALRLPPLVHHEDGFNEDEAVRLKTSRSWYRRLALARAQGLIVPSQQLEKIARQVWQQPRRMVHRIANGIPVTAYGGKARNDALRRLVKRDTESWVGTLAGLRAIKNLPRLVRAFAGLPEHWQLVILGEGPEREAIRAEAERLGVQHRVHLPGFAKDPARVMPLFDIFALSSDSEQFPISVVEAMATRLPVVSPMVGDVAAMVAPENRPYLAAAGDEAALAAALEALAGNPSARAAVGAANRIRAERDYNESEMIKAYGRVYGNAMGQRSFP